MNRKITICPWLFLTAAVMYEEGLLLWWTVHRIPFPAVLFSAAFGLMLGIAVGFSSKPSGAKGAAIAAAAVPAVIRFGMYVIFDAYREFLTPGTIIGCAGGVASDFLGIAVAAVMENLWRLGVLLVPAIAYGAFCSGVSMSRRGRSILVIVCAVLYLAGFSQAGETYRFDHAVRQVGLHGGFLTEALRRHSDFVAPEPFSSETTAVKTETQPEESVPVTNPTREPMLDFEALAAAEPHKGIRSLHAYVSEQTPGTINEYTGLFAGKNLIFITAEAFSSQVIDPVRTPTLYRLATEGIRFGEYYQPAWGGSTTAGEFANLLGLIPVGGGKCMEEAVQQELFFTVPAQLQKHEYYSAAFHNHSYTYYNRDETHARLGYDTFLAMGNGLEAGVSKRVPESDVEMLEYTLPLYLDRQPFSVYYMTMSGHALYSKGGNAMARKHYHRVAELPYPEAVKCYLAANLELEDALACLLQQLENAGIAEDTVIVLASDHYPYGLEKSSAWGNEKNYLQDLYDTAKIDCFVRDRSTLIIWSGSIEGKNIGVDAPVSSLDILPTLLNLFGLPFDARLFPGRDVFSDAQPLVLWPDHSWRTEYGFYYAPSGQFLPETGTVPDESYREKIHARVSNIIAYCEKVCRYDYFNVLAPLME